MPQVYKGARERVQARLPADVYQQVIDRCRRDDTTINDVIVAAVRQMLTSEGK